MNFPSGVFMLSFKFGYIVTGKCSNSNNYCSTQNNSGYHTLFVSAGVKQDLCCLTDTTSFVKVLSLIKGDTIFPGHGSKTCEVTCESFST